MKRTKITIINPINSKNRHYQKPNIFEAQSLGGNLIWNEHKCCGGTRPLTFLN